MQKPPPYVLQLYYENWKRGKTDSAILVSINEELQLDGSPPISRADYRKTTPFFFNYTRQRVYQETLAGTFVLEKTEEIEDKFVEYVTAGVPYDKAARLMNIPMNTLMDIWFKDPIFKARVDYAVEFANTAVTMALFKRATGYKVLLRSHTKGKNAEGNGVLETETVREEHIMPSVEAAKFWLVNKSGGKWSLNGESSKIGNKAKILEAIEDMTELTDTDMAAL
jgi:hypothetical protein